MDLLQQGLVIGQHKKGLSCYLLHNFCQRQWGSPSPSKVESKISESHFSGQNRVIRGYIPVHWGYIPVHWGYIPVHWGYIPVHWGYLKITKIVSYLSCSAGRTDHSQYNHSSQKVSVHPSLNCSSICPRLTIVHSGFNEQLYYCSKQIVCTKTIKN